MLNLIHLVVARGLSAVTPNTFGNIRQRFKQKQNSKSEHLTAVSVKALQASLDVFNNVGEGEVSYQL